MDGQLKTVYIGIGSNLGGKIQNILTAYKLLNSNGKSIIRSSSFYQTPPWGFNSNEDFINTVVKIETNKEPENLLKDLKSIENKMGRIQRSIDEAFSNRIIDLDIIDYNGEVVEMPNLSIPHLRLSERNFVIIPLQEIEPNWVHPVSKVSVLKLVNQLVETNITKVSITQ